MAEKGARQEYGPEAWRLYVEEGRSLTDIAKILPVSVNSLSTWKRNTLRPGESMDEWDKARLQHRSLADRVHGLMVKIVTDLEDCHVEEMLPGKFDSLVKSSAVWERLNKQAREQRVTEKIEETIKKNGISAETVQTIREQFGL